MSASTYSLLLGLLAVVAVVGAVVALVGRLSAPRLRPTDNLALTGAFGIAAVATAGSLIYSEVFNFVPCELCWFQRILMYPLAVILGVAWWRGDLDVRRYATPLAVIGLGVSTWHVLIQRVPTIDGATCSADAPCSAIWVEALGFLTIPTMALIGFVAITVLLSTAVVPAATDEEELS